MTTIAGAADKEQRIEAGRLRLLDAHDRLAAAAAARAADASAQAEAMRAGRALVEAKHDAQVAAGGDAMTT